MITSRCRTNNITRKMISSKDEGTLQMIPTNKTDQKLSPSTLSSSLESSTRKLTNDGRIKRRWQRTSFSSFFRPSTLTTLLTLNSLFVMMAMISTPMAEAAEFDIEKLQEYNSLASCIGQIHKDFEVCNTRGAEKARSFKVDLGEEWNRRLQCCGMWKLRDCWMKAARAKCTKAQAEQIFKLPHLFLPDLATSCAEFTPESGKCTVPVWLIASVASAALILTLSCLCGTCYCVKRLRARVNRRSALHHRHQKRSLTNSLANSNGGDSKFVPSLTNGGKQLNGKKHSRPKNGYTNGGANGGLAKVTINIEEATSDEVKSLNAVDPSTVV